MIPLPALQGFRFRGRPRAGPKERAGLGGAGHAQASLAHGRRGGPNRQSAGPLAGPPAISGDRLRFRSQILGSKPQLIFMEQAPSAQNPLTRVTSVAKGCSGGVSDFAAGGMTSYILSSGRRRRSLSLYRDRIAGPLEAQDGDDGLMGRSARS